MLLHVTLKGIRLAKMLLKNAQPTFVVKPLPQTSHLNGLSLVWLRMWISRAELHANTLKQIWQVVLPRAANISSMSGSIWRKGNKIKLEIKQQPNFRLSKLLMVLQFTLYSNTYVSSLEKAFRTEGSLEEPQK